MGNWPNNLPIQQSLTSLAAILWNFFIHLTVGQVYVAEMYTCNVFHICWENYAPAEMLAFLNHADYN